MGIALILLTYFVLLVGGTLGVALFFRWLIKRLTGYDIWYFHGMPHEYLKREVDFAELHDWDHERGFGASEEKRKSRKEKATPHYDRLHAMEQAQEAQSASERLTAPSQNADSPPVPLSEIISDTKEKQGRD